MQQPPLSDSARANRVAGVVRAGAFSSAAAVLVWAGPACAEPEPAAPLGRATETAAKGAAVSTPSPGALSPVQLRADFGFLGVLQHDYQQGDPGSNFDFHDEGGQDVLFPVTRYIVNVDLAERHRLSFVYQPLELRTRERLRRGILIAGTAYAAGQDMEFTYRFPFYRASYEYTFWRDERTRFGIGGGLQIRNATIEFSHSDGTNLVSERDVGPVPLLHVGVRHELDAAWWFELDADGIYAPVKYLNGNDNGVEGAILDANVRLGIDAVPHVSPFLGVRYLGGGAQGASDEGDLADYTSNWLQFVIVSLGAELH